MKEPITIADLQSRLTVISEALRKAEERNDVQNFSSGVKAVRTRGIFGVEKAQKQIVALATNCVQLGRDGC